MASPKTAAGTAGLAAIIKEPGRALLAFDFDGVLAPIVDDPELAEPYPGMFTTLASIGQLVGSLVIITGRPVSFVTSRTGFEALTAIPGFRIYGHYGLETWDVASRATSVPPAHADIADIAAVRSELEALVQREPAADGSWIEDKGHAVAVHTRRAADPAGALAVLSTPVQELASRNRLRVEPGKMVLEIRPPGVYKGDVLARVVREGRFGSVLYAGDDLGDLSAFAAIDELTEEGLAGVKVCSASGEAPEVAQAADLVVDGPAGLAALLAGLRGQISGDERPA
jgi:trehalose 6-phosphate phosphatase